MNPSNVDKDLLGISWHDSNWIPHLSAANVMDYFMERSNPFYDRTSNNETIKMQHVSPDHLSQMVGREYSLIHVMEPILYVIRLVHRHNHAQVTPLSDYYIIGGVIYQAPDLSAVLSSRLTNTIGTLRKTFDEAHSHSRYHPSKGYFWHSPQGTALKAGQGKEEEKKKEEPVLASWFQRQRTDLLLGELTKKFPRRVVTKPAAEEGDGKQPTGGAAGSGADSQSGGEKRATTDDGKSADAKRPEKIMRMSS